MENQVNLYQPLALFVPNSAGDSNALLKLTLQAVSQTFPLLSHLLGVVGRTKLSPVRIEQLFTDAEGKAAADRRRHQRRHHQYLPVRHLPTSAAGDSRRRQSLRGTEP